MLPRMFSFFMMVTAAASARSCVSSAFFTSVNTNRMKNINSRAICHRHDKKLSLLTRHHFGNTHNNIMMQSSSSSIMKYNLRHCHRRRSYQCPSSLTNLLAAPADDEEDDTDNDNNYSVDPASIIPNDLGLQIIRGTGIDNAQGEISDEIWEDIETSAPSTLMIMKNVSFQCWCVNFIIIVIGLRSCQ